MAIKPETRIVNAIQDWVKEHGGKSVKYHGDAMGELGQPDLIIGLIVRHKNTYRALHMMVEVKTDDGVMAPIQRYRLAEWAELGYLTSSPRSLEQFIQDVDYLADMGFSVPYHVAEGTVYRVKS